MKIDPTDPPDDVKKDLLRTLAFALGLIVILLLNACATRSNSLELGAGYNRHIDVGTNPQSIIRYRNEPRDNGSGWVVEYDHHSSFREGYPFNTRPEDLTDQFSVIYRWVF